MKFRWIVICLLLLALPSLLYADWTKNWSKRTVKIKGDAFGTVVFNHLDHFDYLGQRICTRCHPGIFNVIRSKNPDFTMEEMEKGKACGACHNGDVAFAVMDNCASCHPTKDIAFKGSPVGTVTFSHEVHTGMFSCSSCHPGLFIPGPGNKELTMEKMGEGEFCGACHDGSTAFSVKENCENCHQM